MGQILQFPVTEINWKLWCEKDEQFFKLPMKPIFYSTWAGAMTAAEASYPGIELEKLGIWPKPTRIYVGERLVRAEVGLNA